MRRWNRLLRAVAPATAVTAFVSILAATAASADVTTPNTDSSTPWYILTHPRALSLYLGLSADQNAQAKPIWQALHTTEQPLRDARPALCTAFEASLTANPQDPNAVGEAALGMYANKQSLLAARQTFDAAFSAILTSDQLIKYEALKQLATAEDKYFNPIGQCLRASS